MVNPEMSELIKDTMELLRVTAVGNVTDFHLKQPDKGLKLQFKRNPAIAGMTFPDLVEEDPYKDPDRYVVITSGLTSTAMFSRNHFNDELPYPIRGGEHIGDLVCLGRPYSLISSASGSIVDMLKNRQVVEPGQRICVIALY